MIHNRQVSTSKKRCCTAQLRSAVLSEGGNAVKRLEKRTFVFYMVMKSYSAPPQKVTGTGVRVLDPFLETIEIRRGVHATLTTAEPVKVRPK